MFDFKTVFKSLVLSILLMLNYSCKVDQVALEKAASESGIDLSSLNKGSLTIVGGNNQIVAQNTIATKNLEVIARDADGAAKPNEDVTFEVLTENGGLLTGSVTTKTVTTSATGKASISFTAGSDTGEVIIYASSSSGNVSFTQTVINSNNGSAGTSLIIIKGNNQSVEQNAPASESLEVLALDSTGAPIQNIGINFEVLTSGAGTLSASTATTGTNGRASVNFTASNQLGSATIIATSIAGSAAFSVTTIEAGAGNVNPLGSTLLMVKGNNSIVEQNTTTILEVLALNSAGVAIPDIDVTFEVLTSGTVSNPQPTSGTASGTGLAAKTGANGRANVTFTAPSSLGNATIIARSSAGSAAFNLSVGVQGIGSTLSISNGNGQVIVPNTKATEDLEVIATSASGSPLSGITVTFTVTTTSGGVLSNSQGILVTQTDANGKAKTSFTSSNTTGPISVLASSSVGSVNFALNTSSNGGTGGGGSISFNPSTLSPAEGSWLNTNVGAAPSKTITITNTASFGLYINSIFTSAGTEFTIVSDDCPKSPTPLASTASCTVIVSFSPSSSATFSRFLFLNWSALNDGSNGQNAVLPLQGSGPPALAFNGIGLIDNVTTSSIRLNWSAATGGTVSQYRVYRITNGVASLITNLASNVLTYSISGLSQNTIYTYRVRAVNTANEEDGNNNDVSIQTDMSPVPVLTDVGNFVFPTNPIYAGGSALALDFNKTNVTPPDLPGDSGINFTMSYTCKFSRIVTNTIANKTTSCTQGALGGIFTFNQATGVFSWVPKLGTQGVYEFVISGTDSFGTGYRYFTVNVGHPYANPNISTILADFRASFSNMTTPNTSGANSWSDISGKNNNGTVISGTPIWSGSTSNTNTDPQRVSFNGTTQIDLGPTLSGYGSFFFDFWVSNPESSFSNGSIVLRMDSDDSNNGFKITQTTQLDNNRALRFDFERNYDDVIATHNPLTHIRFDELSGSTFSSTNNTVNFIYGNGAYGTTSTTGLVIGQAGATLGEKTSTAIKTSVDRLNIPNISTFKPSGDFTVEFWVKYDNSNLPADHDLYTFNTTGTASGLRISMESGVLTVRYKPTSAPTFTLLPIYTNYGAIYDGNWHHLAFVSSSTNNKSLYVDGTLLSYSAINNGAITWPVTPDGSWLVSGGDSNNPVSVDEFAFYGFALSQNQIKDHLAAADHFNRNQALFPANSIAQTRPHNYWRGSDGYRVLKDYTGNQCDLYDYNNQNYSMYKTTGVYARSGGSNLDQDLASYPSGDNWSHWSWQGNCGDMSFNDKFTYTTWVNFSSNTSAPTPLFSFSNWGNANYGFVAYAQNDGRLYAVFNRTWTTNPNNISTASPVVPYNGNSILPLGWYHITLTYDGTKSNDKRVQFYINGVPVKMSAPTGTIPTSLSTLTGRGGSGWEFYLASTRTTNGAVLGSSRSGFAHDEDALYDKVLPINEIRAQANEASLRYCDIPITTQGLDPVNTKPFDFISAKFDGTTLDIIKNSRRTCSLRPMVNLSSENLSLVLGDSSKGFVGHITDLRIHGSDTSSTVATTQNQQNAFYNSADQHHVVPLGNIITTNLVRWYEASTAMDGMRPYSPGCSDNKIDWFDMGQNPNGLGQENGRLINFSNCNNTGWMGSGIPTDPYRLTFDGTNDWVDLGTKPFFNSTPNKLTVCTWVRTIQPWNNTTIFGRYDNGWGDFALGTYVNNPYGISLALNGANPVATGNNSDYNNLKNGLWHYVCGQVDGSNYRIYLDGKVVLGPVAFTSNINNSSSHDVRATLGRLINSSMGGGPDGWFNGDIGAVHIYNDGLTQAQIKQNCAAQAANYNMTTCVP